MSQIRPKGMTTEQFSSMMKQHGFPACSKAAIRLAERPKDTGVQFTPEARKAAQGLLNSKPRVENRVNGNKTTVWLDDELREWVETRAYMEDMPVGEFIRGILREARRAANDRPYDKKEAASDAATSEAAEMVPNDGRADVVIGPYGHLHDTPKQEENQA